MKKGFIYIIKNIINNKRYVGKTFQNIQRRYKQHFSDALNPNCRSYNCIFQKAIRKYGENNFILEYFYEFNDVTEENLNQLECYYIKYYNTYIHESNDGYNMTLGGDGGLHGIPLNVYDLEFNFIMRCQSISDASQKLDIKATTLNSGLTKQNSEQRMIIFKNQFFIQYIDRQMYQYLLPLSMKKVDIYTLSGEYIKTSESMIEIANELGVTPNSISACCRGKTIQCNGVVIRYHGEPFDKFNRINKRSYKVALFDVNDILIGEYKSILFLSKILNISPSLIQKKLKSGESLLDKYYIKRV